MVGFQGFRKAGESFFSFSFSNRLGCGLVVLVQQRPTNKTTTMKKYSPAKNTAEYAALVNKDIELRQLIAILADTVREGGCFAESAAEQIIAEQAEAQQVTEALANTRTRYNDVLETTEIIA